jgi:16S rRNA (cytosine1402-N4)-methyltransferase
MDLGVSSHQLDEATRGFSYQRQGELDMRMNPLSDAPTAFEVVMKSDVEELERIIRQYGEERWSKRIAEFIAAEREAAPIRTTDQLVTVIKKAIPAGARREGPHPAKRTFQALRIYINEELDILEQAISDAVGVLGQAGRLAAISFHSLEDRIIKNTFKKLATGCTCPKSMPICVCGKKEAGRILTVKPVLPGRDEVDANPRSRGAKLRVFEKGAAQWRNH